MYNIFTKVYTVISIAINNTNETLFLNRDIILLHIGPSNALIKYTFTIHTYPILSSHIKKELIHCLGGTKSKRPIK